jgi:hypothetical protein
VAAAAAAAARMMAAMLSSLCQAQNQHTADPESTSSRLKADIYLSLQPLKHPTIYTHQFKRTVEHKHQDYHPGHEETACRTC